MNADTELNHARRLHVATWLALVAIYLIVALCMASSQFSFVVESGLLASVETAAAFAAVGYVISRWSWGLRPAFVLLALAQLNILFLCGTPLSYIAASAALPLQDHSLARLDELLGLDWPGYYRYFVSQPELLRYVPMFYAMIGWLGLGVPLLLGLTKNPLRLQQFTLACVIAVFVTALVSALFPAVGTYQHYGLPPETADFRATGYLVQLDRLPFVRDGSLRALNVTQLGGIVTFPSFHAAAAALALWGCWSVWWSRPIAIVTNGGMLVVTPLVGGHYFIDVIAGIVVAVLATAAASSLRVPSMDRRGAMFGLRQRTEPARTAHAMAKTRRLAVTPCSPQVSSISQRLSMRRRRGS